MILECFQEFEKDENFELILESVSAGAKLGRLHSTVVTIVNDDGKSNKNTDIIVYCT